MNVVTVDPSGRATVSKVDASCNAKVHVCIRATDAMPATTLSMFAESYRLDDADEDLFPHVLPGDFGTQLLRAPVHFGWDHAATMKPSDLDRLLAEYAKRCRDSMRRDMIAGTRDAFTSAAKEAPSEDEEEEELDEEEENMDELSVDEEDDLDENLDSDEGEGEECEDEAFCAE